MENIYKNCIIKIVSSIEYRKRKKKSILWVCNDREWKVGSVNQTTPPPP